MIIRNLCIVGLSAVALAACGEKAVEPAPAPVAAPAASGTIILDSEGLRISTAAPALIAFGTPKAEVAAAISSALGSQPETRPNGDCPNGATEDLVWGETLIAVTRDGLFIGWDNEGDGPRTASGVHVGSTLAEARGGKDFSTPETPFDSVEISVDGVGGFLNAEGTAVGSMFAGDICMAR
ncbi:hypothetical protein BH10PSE1_BH10PSE1_34660 [soil metagenome]